MYSYSHGRFTSPDDFLNDSHIANPQSWNLYAYVRNNPLISVDPTGMITDYVDKETGKITIIKDGKDQVIAASTNQINSLVGASTEAGGRYWRELRPLENSSTNNLQMTRAQFLHIANALYAESSGGYSETFGIFNVLENRAAADGNDVIDQVTDKAPSGVYGVRSKAYGTEKGAAADEKRANVHRAIANARTTDFDLTNGAYYWDGRDFNGRANITGGYQARYKPGYLFNEPHHDLWKQGSNPVKGTYKYQSTQAIGDTTFTKLYNQGKKWYLPK